MTLSDRIRLLRDLAGLSSVAVDDLAGLGRGHTGQIISGARANPELGTLERLARLFGWHEDPERRAFSLDWLVGGMGRRPSRARVIAAVKAAQEVR